MVLDHLKKFVKSYGESVCVCQDCGKQTRVPINQKGKCKHCGSHKLKPVSRAV